MDLLRATNVSDTNAMPKTCVGIENIRHATDVEYSNINGVTRVALPIQATSGYFSMALGAYFLLVNNG
jgi:hypothetical protein